MYTLNGKYPTATLPTKIEQKEMFNDLKYEIKPYPKGKNIRYDASYKPIIQRELFTTI